MIRIVLALCIGLSVHASDEKLASSIFNKILLDMTEKVNPKVYIHTKSYALSIYPGKLHITDRCEEADVVVVSSIKNLPASCNGKLLFGTRYSHLKNKQVVGSFFWQKGRPNILFYRQRLIENDISLDPSFDKYIENN